MATKQKFVERESVAHKTAKEVLADWLRSSSDNDGNNAYCSYSIKGSPNSLRWRPNSRNPVVVEYPFATHPKEGIAGFDTLWDELGFGISPTFGEICLHGYTPIAIADLALIHKGWIGGVIEVVWSNPLSKEKISLYKKIGLEEVYEIDAMWILRQCKKPDELVLKQII